MCRRLGFLPVRDGHRPDYILRRRSNRAAALGVTATSRFLGKKVSEKTDVPTASGTEPAPTSPDDVAAAQTQLALLQWAVPALTGARSSRMAVLCEASPPLAGVRCDVRICRVRAARTGHRAACADGRVTERSLPCDATRDKG